MNENIRFAFRYFNKDGSREITFNENEQVFNKNLADKNKVHEGLKQIVSEVDVNVDGIISFEKYSPVMKKC